MNIFKWIIASASLTFGLSGCIAIDVSEELKLMSTATSGLSDATLKGLKSQIDTYEGAEPDRAAAANEYWDLSVGCDTNEEVFDYGALANCKVIKIADKTVAQSPPTQIQAVQRKLGTLTAYSSLLSDLASAETEGGIKLAYAALSSSVKELGTATDSSGIASFSQNLTDEKKKVDAVVEYAVAAYRNRLLRKSVRRAHPAMVRTTGEIKALLKDLKFDAGYEKTLKAMRVAQLDAQNANIAQDREKMAKAYHALEEKHAAFVKLAGTSIYIKLDQLAATHSGLQARLGQSPSAEALVAYLEALRDLTTVLEE